MYKKKSKKLTLRSLKKYDIVWSKYFNCYVQFVEAEEDGEFFFKFVGKEGYCILYSDDIEEPKALIKELL